MEGRRVREGARVYPHKRVISIVLGYTPYGRSVGSVITWPLSHARYARDNLSIIIPLNNYNIRVILLFLYYLLNYNLITIYSLEIYFSK